MKRKLFHCLICVTLMMALLFGSLPGTAVVKVKAAQTGNWVCTGYTYDQGLEEYLGNLHEMKYEYDKQNGEVKYYRSARLTPEERPGKKRRSYFMPDLEEAKMDG